MFFKQELNELRARKALLQVECRLQRGLVQLELERVRGGFDLLSRGAGWLQHCRPFLPLAAPLVGFVLVRKWRTLVRWGGRAFVSKLIRGIIRSAA